MSSDAFKAFIEELEACAQMRRELKRRAMIYQCEAKERVALANGLPFDAYYDLSYDEWGEVWMAYDTKRKAVSD